MLSSVCLYRDDYEMKPFDDWLFVSFANKCLWFALVQYGYPERNNPQNATNTQCMYAFAI